MSIMFSLLVSTTSKRETFSGPPEIDGDIFQAPTQFGACVRVMRPNRVSKINRRIISQGGCSGPDEMLYDMWLLEVCRISLDHCSVRWLKHISQLRALIAYNYWRTTPRSKMSDPAFQAPNMEEGDGFPDCQNWKWHLVEVTNQKDGAPRLVIQSHVPLRRKAENGARPSSGWNYRILLFQAQFSPRMSCRRQCRHLRTQPLCEERFLL